MPTLPIFSAILVKMFHLVLDSIQQYLETRTTSETAEIHAEFSDPDKWQDFMQQAMAQIENALFIKEFAQDCATISTSTLMNIEGTLKDMATQELEQRTHRQEVRLAIRSYLDNKNTIIDNVIFKDYKDYIDSLSDTNNEEWYRITDDGHININDTVENLINLLKTTMSEEERKEITQLNDDIYLWAIKNHFAIKSNACTSVIPDMVDFLTAHPTTQQKIIDMLTTYFQHLKVDPEAGYNSYLTPCNAMLYIARAHPTASIMTHAQVTNHIRHRLIDAQSIAHPSHHPYAYAMLMTLNYQHYIGTHDRHTLELHTLVQDIVYDYMISQPDPTNLLVMYRSDGSYWDSAKSNVLAYASDMTHPDLEELIRTKCR